MTFVCTHFRLLQQEYMPVLFGKECLFRFSVKTLTNVLACIVSQETVWQENYNGNLNYSPLRREILQVG